MFSKLVYIKIMKNKEWILILQLNLLIEFINWKSIAIVCIKKVTVYNNSWKVETIVLECKTCKKMFYKTSSNNFGLTTKTEM